MENWRSYLDENQATSQVIAGFDIEKAAKEIEAELEKQTADRQLNEELFTLSALAVTVFVKIVGTLALGAMLAKAAAWFEEKRTGNQSEFVKRFENVMQDAAGTVATLGINKIAKAIIKFIPMSSATKDKINKIIEGITKVIVFVICIGAAGQEIVQGAKEAGGIPNFISDLASKAGLDSLDSAVNLGQLFETSLDTAEGTFDGVKFAKAVFTGVKKALQTNWKWLT